MWSRSDSRIARLVFVGLFCAFGVQVQATTVRVANLQELVERSERVFTGRCLSERIRGRA